MMIGQPKYEVFTAFYHPQWPKEIKHTKYLVVKKLKNKNKKRY